MPAHVATRQVLLFRWVGQQLTVARQVLTPPPALGAKDGSMSWTEASKRTWAAQRLNSPFKGEGIWHMKYFLLRLRSEQRRQSPFVIFFYDALLQPQITWPSSSPFTSSSRRCARALFVSAVLLRWFFWGSFFSQCAHTVFRRPESFVFFCLVFLFCGKQSCKAKSRNTKPNFSDSSLEKWKHRVQMVNNQFQAKTLTPKKNVCVCIDQPQCWWQCGVAREQLSATPGFLRRRATDTSSNIWATETDLSEATESAALDDLWRSESQKRPHPFVPVDGVSKPPPDLSCLFNPLFQLDRSLANQKAETLCKILQQQLCEGKMYHNQWIWSSGQWV